MLTYISIVTRAIAIFSQRVAARATLAARAGLQQSARFLRDAAHHAARTPRPLLTHSSQPTVTQVVSGLEPCVLTAELEQNTRSV